MGLSQESVSRTTVEAEICTAWVVSIRAGPCPFTKLLMCSNETTPPTHTHTPEESSCEPQQCPHCFKKVILCSVLTSGAWQCREETAAVWYLNAVAVKSWSF